LWRSGISGSAQRHLDLAALVWETVQMTPTPPNTTARLKVHYTGPFGSHTMLFHALEGGGDVDFRTAVHNIVIAMVGACWNTTTFNLAEFAPAGSNVFSIDTGWTTVTRSSATNPGVSDAPSHFAQFGGRSPTTGKRVKWYLFEDTLRDTEDMRFTTAESGDVDAIVDAITAALDQVGAIDGSAIVPYQYANVGQNDYLTHKARRS
jgi:hypothetical protein